MALLLDKLAKENQDIRLLQAQLQVGTSRKQWGTSLGQVSVPLSSLKKKNLPVYPHTLTLSVFHYSEVTFLVLCSYLSC